MYEKELRDTRVREKTLITKQKRLESKCAEKDERIHSLSLDVSRLQSASMQDLSSMKHSTPLRHAHSEYMLNAHHEHEGDPSDDEDDVIEDYNNTEDKPLSSVRPMAREESTDANNAEYLLDEEEATFRRKNLSSPGIDNVKNITIHQRSNSARSYNSQYTPVKNFYRYETPDGKPVAMTMPRTMADSDNIGVVRPNNSRIGLEATVDTYIGDKGDAGKKKKKKGFMKIFKLCGGGRSSKVQRNNSVYQKTNIRARPIPEERPFPEERLLELNHRL